MTQPESHDTSVRQKLCLQEDAALMTTFSICADVQKRKQSFGKTTYIDG